MRKSKRRGVGARYGMDAVPSFLLTEIATMADLSILDSLHVILGFLAVVIVLELLIFIVLVLHERK